MKPTLLLDMDGVLANFHGACCTLFGITEEDMLSASPERPHDYAVEKYIGKVLGREITSEQLWDRIDREGQFWLEIEPYPWAHDLYEFARGLGYDIIISTSPGNAPWNSAHKISWLRMHLPQHDDMGWMIGKHKHLMSRRGHVLLDDCDHNTDKFDEGDGNVILFPQPWNRLHDSSIDRMTWVHTALRIFTQ